MVLWVSAALSAIGFSLASTVRGETERTATAVDSLRAYYLAVGGVQRGMVELLWTVLHPEERMIPRGSTVMNYNFPSGVVRVEILPEAGKLDVNRASFEDLYRLLLAIGEPEGSAQGVAAAIVAARSGEGGGPAGALGPSFPGPHASFQEIEELLLVKGVTPDLFYGSYIPAAGPDGANAPGAALTRRPGLMDCLSVYGSRGKVDANTASPAVLAALGLSPYAVGALVARRAQSPLTLDQLYQFLGDIGAPSDRLQVEGHSIVTFRATAVLRQPDGSLSDLRRTVAAQVKYLQRDSKSATNVLRWYDTAWSY